MVDQSRKIITTSEAAQLCGVTPRIVSRWFDSGRLRGYRIPGSQDRRIPREYLNRFVKEHRVYLINEGAVADVDGLIATLNPSPATAEGE